MDGAENQQWMELLRDYMVKNHINHTFWCLNPNSGDTGGLLDSQFKVWDEKKYALFEESLWQTSSTGKYIGLDHQTALGKNGLSLNEYYSSYADSEGSNINGGTKGGGGGQTVTTTTATSTTTTTTTTSGPTVNENINWGDANCDGEVNMADAVLVMQAISNPDKYGEGKAEGISSEGAINADVFNTGDGITNNDALSIQKFKLGLISKLPEA